MKTGLFFILFLASCVSGSGMMYTFPMRFYMLQSIEVSLPDSRRTFLAQVKRHDRDVQIVLLQPMLGMPLVTLRRTAGEVSSQWHVPAPLYGERVGDIFKSILYLYDHGAEMDVAHGTAYLSSPGGYTVFALSDFRTNGSCPSMPMKTIASYPSQAKVRVLVTTKERECSP